MALTIDLEAGLRPSPPPRRGTPDGRFVFEKKLGEGAEGSVYLAIPTSSRSQGAAAAAAAAAASSPSPPPRRVAVKVVSGGRAYERCLASRELWPKLVHPNVVFPLESWWDDANRRCFVQMELCQTDLLDLVCDEAALEDDIGSRFAGDLASALFHLHSQGIAHQDVKLENIFVSREGVAKLGDLGSIAQIQPNAILQDWCHREGDASSTESLATYPTTASTSSSSFVGSVMYAPPEANSSSSSSRVAAGAVRDPFAADMWALGVSLWSAMAGCHPWELACVERSKEFREFAREGAENTLPKSFSPGLRSLLARLLSLDPRQRPTAAEVLDCSWVSAPPTTPPTSSLRSALPSWPSSDDPCAEHQRQQQQHRLRQQQQQQQHQQQQQQNHEHQELQAPAPVTPTEIESHDDILVHQDADSAADAAESTAPTAAGRFGFPGPEGLFLNAAEAAAAPPTLAAMEPSPIRSRHRRSKKRKSPEREDERTAAAAPAAAQVVQDRSIAFVLEPHAKQEQEQEQGETFSPEMSALGAVLNSSNGGRDERPTKIARVSPSPLTLPGVMKATTTTTSAAEPRRAGVRDGAASPSAFSGLGTQQGLLEFLKPPPAMAQARQSGGPQRGSRAKAIRPVPTSARAAAAASGSIWGREAITGGGDSTPSCRTLEGLARRSEGGCGDGRDGGFFREHQLDAGGACL